MTINAFHLSYVATHMPSFMTDLRTQSRQNQGEEQ
jgi:hypothetical protein